MASENMLARRGIETWGGEREGERVREISGVPLPPSNTQKKARAEGSRLVKDYKFPKLWIRDNSSWPTAECWVVASNSSAFI